MRVKFHGKYQFFYELLRETFAQEIGHLEMCANLQIWEKALLQQCRNLINIQLIDTPCDTGQRIGSVDHELSSKPK